MLRSSIGTRFTSESSGGKESTGFSFDIDAARAAVEQRFPGRLIVSAGPASNHTWIFRVKDHAGATASPKTLAVYVNAVTNRVLSVRGDSGRVHTVRAAGAVPLVLISTIGVTLLWFVRTRSLLRRLSRHVVMIGLKWDFRTAGGFYLGRFILAVALTSVYFCLLVQLEPAISWFTAARSQSTQMLLTPPRSHYPDSLNNPHLQIQSLVRRALANCGHGCRLRFVRFPAEPTDPWNVMTLPPGSDFPGHYQSNYFDRYDGRYLRRIDADTSSLNFLQPAAIRTLVSR